MMLKFSKDWKSMNASKVVEYLNTPLYHNLTFSILNQILVYIDSVLDQENKNASTFSH